MASLFRHHLLNKMSSIISNKGVHFSNQSREFFREHHNNIDPCNNIVIVATISNNEPNIALGYDKHVDKKAISDHVFGINIYYYMEYAVFESIRRNYIIDVRDGVPTTLLFRSDPGV